MSEARGHHMQYKAKDAYSSDDKKLGHITETDDIAFLVQRGVILSKLFYLPTRLLFSSDVDRAFLSVTHAEAEALAREELPPAGDPWYGSGEGDTGGPPMARREVPAAPEPATALVEEPIGQPAVGSS